MNAASFDKVINDPMVIAAYDILRQAGLLHAAERATIVCIYCGEHITYTDAKNKEYSDEARECVNEHRITCEKFQEQNADIA